MRLRGVPFRDSPQRLVRLNQEVVRFRGRHEARCN